MSDEPRVATGLEALQAIALARSYEPVTVLPPGSLDPGGFMSWRVGNHYGIHVYEGERPVATFHTVLDAEMAVADHNRTLVEITPELVGRCARALREVALEVSSDPEVVVERAQLYAQTVIAALVEQGVDLVKAPPDTMWACANHRPVRHRDGKEPWCEKCGRTAAFTEPLSRLTPRA